MITLRHNTVGRTHLDEWSARRTDLYLTIHNTHNRQTSIPLVGFEPTIWAGERPLNYTLGYGYHWSQNRHNTANQHLSGHTSQARVATFNPACLSRLVAIQGLLFRRLLIVRDVKTHHKHVSLRLRRLGTFSSTSLPLISSSLYPNVQLLLEFMSLCP